MSSIGQGVAKFLVIEELHKVSYRRGSSPLSTRRKATWTQT